MKRILLEALLYPFLVFVLCIGIGAPLVFVGFQNLHIECAKNKGGITSCHVTRKHLFGLYTINAQVSAVKGAHIVKNKGFEGFFSSGAFLITRAIDEPLLIGYASSDETVKRNVVGSINVFIGNHQAMHFSETYKISNIFGMVGLPFLAFGILGILGWPSVIISAVKKLRAS